MVHPTSMTMLGTTNFCFSTSLYQCPKNLKFILPNLLVLTILSVLFSGYVVWWKSTFFFEWLWMTSVYVCHLNLFTWYVKDLVLGIVYNILWGSNLIHRESWHVPLLIHMERDLVNPIFFSKSSSPSCMQYANGNFIHIIFLIRALQVWHVIST